LEEELTRVNSEIHATCEALVNNRNISTVAATEERVSMGSKRPASQSSTSTPTSADTSTNSPDVSVIILYMSIVFNCKHRL